MPIYEVVCPNCDYRVEVLRSYVDVQKERCKVCETTMSLAPTRPNFTGLPTPRYHGKVPKVEDKGFQREWDHVHKDDPTYRKPWKRATDAH